MCPVALPSVGESAVISRSTRYSCVDSSRRSLRFALPCAQGVLAMTVAIRVIASVLMLLTFVTPAVAQAPIKIGEISSFSGIGAPFTGPYRSGIEMAVEETNAKGGVLGRKLEVGFRGE